MPIRPEWRKRFYGPAWREFRREMIRIRGNRCVACGRSVTTFLNLCHTSHDPRTSPVALMCPACHGRHDAPHSFAVRRRTRAKKVGQLWLLPEIEFAAVPAWLIPRRVIAELQEKLF
jgi:hypothetical protein